MTWFTDANVQAEFEKEHMALAFAVDLDFLSGHVRLTTWSGDLTVNGQVYGGIGTLGSISNVPDKVGLTADRWTYIASGVDFSLIPESEINNSFRRSVTEYLVVLDPVTHAVIGYEINREGRISKIRRVDATDAPVIEISCETRLVILENADNYRFTHEHQQDFFAGDMGLDQVKNLDTTEIIWGGSRLSFGSRLARALMSMGGRGT